MIDLIIFFFFILSSPQLSPAPDATTSARSIARCGKRHSLELSAEEHMGKHTCGKARAGPAATQADFHRSSAVGYPDLAALAARHARALHNVSGDGQCLFHALLHALEVQVRDPRAKDYTALSLRHAILDLLCDPGLQTRAWVAACDQDAVSLTNLRETLINNNRHPIRT